MTTKQDLPDVPKVQILRWASSDLLTGALNLPQEYLVMMGVGSERIAEQNVLTSKIQNTLLLKPNGSAFAVFDQLSEHPSFIPVMSRAVREFFSVLSSEMLKQHDAVPKALAQLLRILEQEANDCMRQHTIADLAFQGWSGVIGWLRGSTLHLLKFGSAKVHIDHNRLRAKNVKSLDAVGSYAMDMAANKALKKFKAHKTEKDRKAGKASPQEAYALRSTLFDVRYEIEELEGNDRVMVLISPIWMPAQVVELFRVAGETRNREHACRAVWQMMRTSSDEPSGAFFILDVTPQDADMDFSKDKTTQATQQTTKTVSKAMSGKSSGAAVGASIGAGAGAATARIASAVKTGAAVATTVVVGVATYMGVRAYKQSQIAASQNNVYAVGGAKHSATTTPTTRDSLSPHHTANADSVQPEKPIVAGELRLESPTTIAVFDKLQKMVVPFTFAVPDAPTDSTALALSLAEKRLSVTVRGLDTRGVETQQAITDFTLRVEPLSGKGSKKGKFWLLFATPLPAGAYQATFVYSKGTDTRRATTTFAVVKSELKSLNTLVVQKAFYGKRLKFRCKMLEEVQSSLAERNVSGSITPKMLSVTYKINDKVIAEDMDYTEPFAEGPCVPAWMKKATFEVFWRYAVTGERVLLYTSKEIEPSQLQPGLSAENGFVEFDMDDVPALKTRKFGFVRPITLKLRLKGLQVDFADVPVDADPQTCAVVRAKIEHIEPKLPPVIDFTSPDSQLAIYTEDGTTEERWAFAPSTVRVVKTTFDNAEGTYTAFLEIRNVPPKPAEVRRTLRGKLAITAGAKLTNPLNNKDVLGSNTVILPINLEY
jgi:hypothetical protein